MAKALSAIETKWWGRTSRLAKLAAGSAGRMAAGKVKETLTPGSSGGGDWTGLAKILTEELGQMKGLVMKVGQLASYVDSALPDEARDVLSSLQDSTPAMDIGLIREIFVQDFGKGPEELFRHFDPQPIAAASIGQVHRAELMDGTKVAVKVQYPGIADSFKVDLGNLAKAVPLVKMLFPGSDPQAVLEEVAERSLEECDYGKEASNQETFRAFFADDPSVVIPEVHKSLCSARVLTTTFIEGMRFREFLMRSNQKERNEVAAILHRFNIRSIYELHMFNGDPHPGNYLFVRGPDGIQVCFLDFGCVKTWDRAFISRWASLVLSAMDQDKEAFAAKWKDLGFVGVESKFDYEAQYRQYRVMLRHFMTDEVVRITPADVREDHRSMTKDNVNMRYTRLPKEFVLVLRLNYGLISILAALNAQVNYHRLTYPLVKNCAFAT